MIPITPSLNASLEMPFSINSTQSSFFDNLTELANTNPTEIYSYPDNKDEEKDVDWYRKVAKQGDVIAQSILGTRYAEGEGVPKDEKKAVYWYRKAAEQGNANAQVNLGWHYANGKGVSKDEKKAVYWNQKAAEQGNDDAQYNLGIFYAKGKGILKDDEKAVYWLQKAVEQGNANAQVNLGLLFNEEGSLQKIKKLFLRVYEWLMLP